LVKARDEAVAALAEGKGIDGQAELLLKFSKRDVLDALMAEEEQAEDEDEDD
jgi:hypothetical protein